MIAEAHVIRENQTFSQVAINQARQLQNHTEETVSQDIFFGKIFV